jgi:hypothetical protein
MQSPLLVPDKKTGESSRNVRILAFDIAAKKLSAEYVYRTELAGDIDPKSKDKQDDIKLSGLVAYAPNKLLVLERTDALAKLFVVDLSKATNVLGKAWDDKATAPSLEALGDLAAAEITPLAKSLAADLTRIAELPEKIEGIAVLDRSTIALANDSDFVVGTVDASGVNVGKGAKCRLIVLKLDKPLP